MGWAGHENLSQIERNPSANRIHAIGYQDLEKSMEYIRAADLFVLPSREEALPLTILEAMYLETPIVASDVAGIPDEIENGKSGQLFSHVHPEGLPEAIMRMANEPELRSSCVRAAKARYETHFSRKLYFERWRALVEEFIRK